MEHEQSERVEILQGDEVCEETENDPCSEWIVYQTGEPAADAIAHYIFVEPWIKTKSDDGKRPPPLAVEIKEREGSRPTGREITIFSHGKRSGDLAEELDEFFADRLQPGEPEPVRFIWAVMRSPLPELRDYDSRRTFHIVNRAWIDAHSANTSGITPAGFGQGLPPSIFTGPSPLGVDPKTAQQFVVPAIHGDIGGTGMRDLVFAMTDAFSRMTSVVEKNQMFYADLCARQCQAVMAMTEQVGRVLLSHPDVEIERYRMEHEWRIRQTELQGEADAARQKETSGVVKDLGGKLLDNPGLTAALIGVARKCGVTQDDLTQLVTGDDKL